MQDNRELGGEGEQMSRALLQRSGYRIVETNYRTQYGEVDIIAEDGEYIVFVEVKTRRSRSYGMPFEAVTRRKQAHIVRTALQFLKQHRLIGRPLRFDVVSIGPGPGEAEIIKAAFTVQGNFTC